MNKWSPLMDYSKSCHLRWKGIDVINTLAYHDMYLTTADKSIVLKASGTLENL
jgi:hypothetical protein